jgi:hypothetical protein
MINEAQKPDKKIDELQAEIDKMTLLTAKLNEAMQNPFLNVDLRRKYQMATRECEKKIKILKGDIKAIHIMNNMDMDNIETPKHYQHHRK